MALRFVLTKLRASGRNLAFVLVVGTNERAYRFADMIQERTELGYRLVGYLDDVVYSPKKGVEPLGGLSDFSRIIATSVVDEVMITLPVKSYYDLIQEIVAKAEEQGLVVRYSSDLFTTKIFRSTADMVEDIPVLEMEYQFQTMGKRIIKRVIDIVLGSFLLVLVTPILFVAAIAIKLTSSGPIFFVQKRVGYNKRIFSLYKLRTMVKNAEKMQDELESINEMDGPVFKIRDDPRITSVGYWLRKTSVDELPQLFNVVKGDMSLVGPRPLPIRDYRGFIQDWHRRRFSMRPGMTCLWQINGRSDTSFEDWMKLDMQYIDTWTLSGDMKILLKTVPVVAFGKGAQ
jgi:exopolysaccharide biosynthesis polyprenyl glycosylphosphotransferase